MRLLECLILIALLAAALVRLRGAHRETVTLGTTILAAALLAAHGWVDHTRWQMYPAYAGVALLPLLLLPHIDTRAHLRRGAQGLLLVLALLSGFLAWVLPIPTLPVPAGPHAVGTASLLVEDPERPDPYLTGEARSFMLQIWYPALALENATPIPWMPDARAFSSAIGAQLGLPGWILSHLDLIQSNAVGRAPVLVGAGKLPVVIYSHGWNGSRQVAANQCERLASEGFIVLAPDHTHGAFGTRFPNGRVLLNLPSAMPPDEPAGARQAGIEKLVDMYAGDLVTVLDMLPQLDTQIENPVRGHYDLTNVGLFGHSTGGGAVVEVRATDQRVRAVMGLDPWVEPVSADLRTATMETPFVSIRCEDWVQHRKANNAILADMLAKMPGEKQDLYIEGTKHADFVLLPMLSPLAGLLGQTGSIEAARGLRVVEDYLVSYFTHYLKDATQPAFPDPAQYPEVKAVTNPAL